MFECSESLRIWTEKWAIKKGELIRACTMSYCGADLFEAVLFCLNYLNTLLG